MTLWTRTGRCTLALATCWSASAACLADSIVMKNVVRLAEGASSVRLADIAYLDGPDAERLATVQVAAIDGAAETIEISVDSVRTALDSAGARLSLLDLTGHVTVVRVPAGARPVAMSGLAVDADAAPHVSAAPVALEARTFLAADAVGATTPRGLIAQMLSDVHAGKGARVRLAIEGADDDLLDARGPRRFEIVPLATLSTDRVPMRLIERDADMVVARHEIVVLPTLERDVAVAARAIRRGDAIEGAIDVQRCWIAPSEFARLAVPQRLAGATACDSIGLGERVPVSKLRKPIEVKKNDRVLVRREVGLVAIEISAVAVSEGAIGDRIELRAIDRKDRRSQRTFTATVVGPGRAELKDGL